MKRFLTFALTCFIFACLLVATERRAMALYVDPGTGLLALQSAASVMAAAGFMLRRKIRGLFEARPKEAPAGYVPVAAAKVETRKAHDLPRA